MKILFCHGWHSVVGGVKPTYLRDAGHEVINPALDDDNFDLAVRTAQGEYDQHQPDVIVGSSRGGAVAININSGIGLVTPASLHYGQAAQVVMSRQATLETAYVKHPDRFVRGRPKPPQLPSAVWINPPTRKDASENKRLPEINCPQKPEEASLTHPRPGYPLASCVPAELASVSPDNSKIQPAATFEHPSHA